MPDCNTCKSKNSPPNVPYIVHESAMARQERTIKRLVIMLIVILAIWFSTIGVFVWYLNQYDFENYDVEVSTDGGGDANYIGNDGNIYNGTGYSTPENSN